MKRFKTTMLALAIASVSVLTACGESRADDTSGGTDAATSSATADFGAVAPALEHYDTTVVEGDLWQRPGLSLRDRSLVTTAAIIARGQSVDLGAEVARGLDNGLTPAEVSEVITHLAFYGSWPNAQAAARAVRPVFEERGVNADELPAGEVESLPQDSETERQRLETVDRNYGDTAAGVQEFTTDVLFGDLWLRPGLAPRDRSLVTVTALVANGQTAQIPFHLGRAMDNGLTADEASESLSQLAFYAGWPNVFSAIPVFREVLESRD